MEEVLRFQVLMSWLKACMKLSRSWRQRPSGHLKILRGEAHMCERLHHEVTEEVEDGMQQQLQQHSKGLK